MFIPLSKIRNRRYVTAEEYNRLVDRLNALSRITADKNLRLTKGPTGVHLSLEGQVAAATTPSLTPVAWYLFNSNSAADVTGHGHDGTFGGDAHATLDGAYFDGSGDYVDCGPDYIGAGDITFCAWVMPQSKGEGDNGYLVTNGKFTVEVIGIFMIRVSSDGSNYAISNTFYAVNPMLWSHVAITRTSDGTTNIYVNGELSGSSNQYSGTPEEGTTNVYIGNDAGLTHCWHGFIDDVRVYNKILTQNQVRRIYEESNPKRYIHCNAMLGALQLMRVSAAASGDGLYSGSYYLLDATNWSDTTGASKITASGDMRAQTILNIAEYDPESEYVPQLNTGDLLLAAKMVDDEGNDRWIGIPLRQQPDVRMAFCKEDAGSGNTIQAYLDKDGTGTEITVHCHICNGSNLNEASPRLQDGDRIFVKKFYDGTNDWWWCLTTFQATEDCVCV